MTAAPRLASTAVTVGTARNCMGPHGPFVAIDMARGPRFVLVPNPEADAPGAPEWLLQVLAPAGKRGSSDGQV